MMLSTEPLRLVCLNGNGIPVFEQSRNGGSVSASKSIDDSVARIGEGLDKTAHGINGLDSIVDRMVARLDNNGLFGRKSEEGRKLKGPVEDNLVDGSKADDEIALPVVGHPCLWALVVVPDGHGTKADVHTVVISFDGFGVVTNAKLV